MISGAPLCPDSTEATGNPSQCGRQRGGLCCTLPPNLGDSIQDWERPPPLPLTAGQGLVLFPGPPLPRKQKGQRGSIPVRPAERRAVPNSFPHQGERDTPQGKCPPTAPHLGGWASCDFRPPPPLCPDSTEATGDLSQ